MALPEHGPRSTFPTPTPYRPPLALHQSADILPDRTGSRHATIHEVLPRYEAREVHAIRIRAPQAEVFRALEELTLRELPLFRALMGVRALPARLARPWRRPVRPGGRRGLDPQTPLLDWALRMGFTVLAGRPGSEVVLGGVGQPWMPAGGSGARITDLAGFVAFDQPGFAKLALGFTLEPVPGGTRVITETRVDTTDPLSHRRFGAYWRVIRVWSAATRRSWLRAVKRRAERPPGSAAEVPPAPAAAATAAPRRC